ncbi:hypothetical protein ACEWPM_004215 [Roseovarius sp. S4756]|uniref:hypothetical protein n=1 Tax=Roseovarius maritimus TaxID=3342637 RepID=UPI00372B25BA
MDVPLHQHWHDIHIRRWLIVFTSVAAGGLAYFGSLAMTPVFEAKTTFYLAANATPSSFSGSVPDAPQKPLFPIPEEKAASLDVGILRGQEMMTALAADAGVPRSDLQRQIDVTVSGEFMIDVFVRDPDPQKAADIVKRVPVLYRQFHEASLRTRADEIARALTGQITTLEAELAALRTERQRLRAASASTADESALQRIQAERDVALHDLRSADSRIAEMMARRDAVAQTLQEETALYRDGLTIETTTALDNMLQSILELRVELASVTDGVASPRREAIEAQITELETAMDAERRRLTEAAAKSDGSLFERLRLERALTQADLAEELAARTSTEATVEAVTDRFEMILQAVGKDEVLSQRIAALEGQIAALADNASAAALQAANASAPLVVVTTGEPPFRPVFPLPLLNMVVALICGAIFGAYYAIYLAHMERGRRLRRSAEAPPPIFTSEEIAALRSGAPLVLRNRGSGGTDG